MFEKFPKKCWGGFGHFYFDLSHSAAGGSFSTTVRTSSPVETAAPSSLRTNPIQGQSHLHCGSRKPEKIPDMLCLETCL